MEDKFDLYFRRADLDNDGRISGAEAVSFFQASNLPKPVLAQIWQFADDKRTGFLGRQEFYNALKLVTVAQTKRELTQDIVRAALYGPASAKIPAPHINPPSSSLNGFTRPTSRSEEWPKMTLPGVNKYIKVFMDVDTDRDGKITGEQARTLFLSWRLPREILKQVWDLSDQDNDTMLSLTEFCIALYLMERHREGRNLPPTLPTTLLLDQTLLSLTTTPSSSSSSSYTPPAPGIGSLPPQQGMPAGSHPMPPAALRSSMPASQSMQNAQNLSNADQNNSHSISRETSEPEKQVEDIKVILDSREKMAFYRNKMQDLVLYKSRCDNRLNEITERALADKREAELLAKKYEEKYKQVADVASKLTIEEASFRDIQERKMELNQALVKMEQGGSADGILQVRADRIQSDLEELLKALAERCKKHGINVKSTAVIELPQGWQPGVPEISAVWDEDWDKFEDEGFQFDVVVPGNAKSTSAAEKMSSTDNVSQDSYSNADWKSDKALEEEEEESTKSPSSRSTITQKIFESPTKEDYFGKSFDADTERSFDDQGWGTFDNNEDVDSVWGFNNNKDKHEEEEESYFFDSTRKTPFGFDESVPGSPRYTEGSFFENFSSYDPKRETFSSTTPDNNLSRFDSMNSSTAQDRGFARFDSMSSYSFDEPDPFGSTGPFKVPKNEF